MIAVCSHVEEIKKGGRPKIKVQSGRKPELSALTRTLHSPSSLLQDLDALTKDIPSIRFDEFSKKFILPENLRKELLRSACFRFKTNLWKLLASIAIVYNA